MCHSTTLLCSKPCKGSHLTQVGAKVFSMAHRPFMVSPAPALPLPSFPIAQSSLSAPDWPLRFPPTCQASTTLGSVLQLFPLPRTFLSPDVCLADFLSCFKSHHTLNILVLFCSFFFFLSLHLHLSYIVYVSLPEYKNNRSGIFVLLMDIPKSPRIVCDT